MSSKCIFVLTISAVFATGKAQAEVYNPPILVPRISGACIVGIKNDTKIEVTYELIRENRDSFSLERKWTNNSSQSAVDERVSQTVPNPRKKDPSFGGFLTGLVTSIATDNPLPVLAAFGDLIDSAVASPTVTTYTSTYSTRSSTSRSYDDVTKQTRDWLSTIKDSYKRTYSVDINRGYLRCGIRVTNVGRELVALQAPSFSIYLNDTNDGTLQLAAGLPGTVAGAQTKFVLAPGKSQDFTLEKENEDYEQLLLHYATASSVSIALDPPQIEVGGAAVTLDAFLDPKLKAGVFVRIQSEGRNSVSIASVPSAGLTVKEILDAMGLDVDMAATGPVELAVTRIESERNVGSGSVDAAQGVAMIRWRRWLVVVIDSFGSPIREFPVDKKLKPGYALLLFRPTSKELLGDQYRPVVEERRDVKVVMGQPFQLAVSTLEPGDKIRIGNIRLSKLQVDRVKFRVSDRTGQIHDSLVELEPLRQQFGRSSTSTSAEGLSVFLFEPISVAREAIASPALFLGAEHVSPPQGADVDDVVSSFVGNMAFSNAVPSGRLRDAICPGPLVPVFDMSQFPQWIGPPSFETVVLKSLSSRDAKITLPFYPATYMPFAVLQPATPLVGGEFVSRTVGAFPWLFYANIPFGTQPDGVAVSNNPSVTGGLEQMPVDGGLVTLGVGHATFLEKGARIAYLRESTFDSLSLSKTPVKGSDALVELLVDIEVVRDGEMGPCSPFPFLGGVVAGPAAVSPIPLGPGARAF